MAFRIGSLVYQRGHPADMLWHRVGRAFDRRVPEAFWEMNHIVPVHDGGGSCGLDNLETFCVPCHAEVTKAQSAARAAKRREAAMERKRRIAAADLGDGQMPMFP